MAKATVKEITPSGEVKTIVIKPEEDIQERIARMTNGTGGLISSEALAKEIKDIGKSLSKEAGTKVLESILKRDLIMLKEAEAKVTIYRARDIGLMIGNYVLMYGEEKRAEKAARTWLIETGVVKNETEISVAKKIFENCFNTDGSIDPAFRGIPFYKAYLLSGRSTQEIEEWKNLSDKDIKKHIADAKKAEKEAAKKAEAEAQKSNAEAAQPAEKSTEAAQPLEKSTEATQATDKPTEATQATEKPTEATEATQATEKHTEATKPAEKATEEKQPAEDIKAKVSTLFTAITMIAQNDHSAIQHILDEMDKLWGFLKNEVTKKTDAE